MPALSVRERFLVALREYKSDSKVTVRTANLTPSQLREYQDYARFVVALNNNLGTYVDVYANQAGFIQKNLEGQIARLDNAASVLEEEHGIAREVVTWRTLRSKRDVSVPGYLRGLSFQLATQFVVEVDGFWEAIRAVEMVWSEAEPNSEKTQSTRLRACGTSKLSPLVTLSPDNGPRHAFKLLRRHGQRSLRSAATSRLVGLAGLGNRLLLLCPRRLHGGARRGV